MSDGVTEAPTPAPARPAAVRGPARGKSVSKVFGGLVAVSDVGFSIPRLSIVSIIGPNGAGKTTVFNMITGLLPPTTGTIAFDGQSIAGERPDRITALGIARTFQNIRLFATMTALENVMVGQHARLHAGLFGSLLRAAAAAPRGAARRATRRSRCWSTSACAARWPTSWRSTCPTATSAAWRSRARSPPSPSCCCSTSRRPA